MVSLTDALKGNNRKQHLVKYDSHSPSPLSHNHKPNYSFYCEQVESFLYTYILFDMKIRVRVSKIKKKPKMHQLKS